MIKVGALNPESVAWNDWFPDDLPADWRLTFYANEFVVVMIPASAWLQAGEDGPWMGRFDWPPHLTVYAELSPALLPWQGAEVLELLAARGLRIEAWVQFEPLPAPAWAQPLLTLQAIEGGWRGALGDLPVWVLQPELTNNLRALRAWLERERVLQCEEAVLLVDAPAHRLQQLGTLMTLML